MYQNYQKCSYFFFFRLSFGGLWSIKFQAAPYWNRNVKKSQYHINSLPQKLNININKTFLFSDRVSSFKVKNKKNIGNDQTHWWFLQPSLFIYLFLFCVWLCFACCKIIESSIYEAGLVIVSTLHILMKVLATSFTSILII